MDDLRSYKTVQKWIEVNKPTAVMPMPVNMDEKIDLLGQYLKIIDLDPDTFVETSSDWVEGGTKRRNDYLKELKRWVRSLDLSSGEATRVENTIRGFLISNSIKVKTKPYEDVHNPSARS